MRNIFTIAAIFAAGLLAGCASLGAEMGVSSGTVISVEKRIVCKGANAQCEKKMDELMGELKK
jgi:hypothetical protein